MTPTINCYKLLQLEKETGTINDVKKAYRKLALQYHPDKQPQDATEEEKQKANESFQNLGMAYAVLSDPKRKARYDRTGSIEEGEFDGDKDWNAYFKELWTGVVNAETIKAQKLKYQGSEEEKKDLLEAYTTYKGNMDHILEVIECSTAVDGERFEKIIKEAIKDKLVTKYKLFETTTTSQAHQKRIEKEKKREIEFENRQEADKAAKKSKSKKKSEEDNSDEAFLALMKQRNKDRHANMNSIIESLEANAKKEKGGSGGKKRKQKQQEEGQEPSEEEFLKLQEKLFSKKSRK